MKFAKYILVLSAVICMSSLLTFAEPERGSIRGIFIERAERQVAEQEYLAIVVKPLESDDHVTIIVPRRNEDLMQAARKLEPGRQVTLAFVNEADQRWLQRIAVQRGDGDPEQPRLVRRGDAEQPRLVRRAEAEQPRLVRQSETLRPRVVREGDQPAVRRIEGDRPAVRRAEGDLASERPAAADQEELQRIVRESMGRLTGAFRRLNAQAQQMQREIRRLRAENERLRALLAKNGIEVDGPRDGEPRREGDAPRREGEVRRDGDQPRRDRAAEGDRPRDAAREGDQPVRDR